MAALEDATLDAGVLRTGRRFAGSGRMGPITVSPGRVSAVADDPEGLVETVVHLATLSDADWARFTAQVAAEAGHLAALLDGEVPRSLVQSADAAGVALLPGVGDLDSECDCPDVGNPCAHAAALCYQTAWLLDEDPFVLLLLRGRDGRALLDALDRASDAWPALPAGSALDRPVPAAEAYADDPVPLPDRPVRTGSTAIPTVPPPPGFDADTLPRLAAEASRRARALLTGGGTPQQRARTIRDDHRPPRQR